MRLTVIALISGLCGSIGVMAEPAPLGAVGIVGSGLIAAPSILVQNKCLVQVERRYTAHVPDGIFVGAEMRLETRTVELISFCEGGRTCPADRTAATGSPVPAPEQFGAGAEEYDYYQSEGVPQWKDCK